MKPLCLKVLDLDRLQGSTITVEVRFKDSVVQQIPLEWVVSDRKSYEQQQSHIIKLREEVTREFVSDTYKREADELERQAKTIERINQLRAEMGNIEQQDHIKFLRLWSMKAVVSIHDNHLTIKILTSSPDDHII